MSLTKPTAPSGSLLLAGAWRAAATAAVLSVAAMGAQAQVQTVLNALKNKNGTNITPTAFSFNCFDCTTQSTPDLKEIGDIVTLGGTQRYMNSADIMVGQFTDPSVTFSSYIANVTFSVYSVSNIGPNPTVALIGTKTNSYVISGDNSAYFLNFDFTGQGFVMPDTIYYGVSVSSSSPLVAGLRMGLFDYLDTRNYGSGAVGSVPFGTLQAGTDVGNSFLASPPPTGGPFPNWTVMYARTVANPGQVTQTIPGSIGGQSINTGNTGAVLITAIPEPQTYALMFLGVIAVVGFSAKRTRRA